MGCSHDDDPPHGGLYVETAKDRRMAKELHDWWAGLDKSEQCAHGFRVICGARGRHMIEWTNGRGRTDSVGWFKSPSELCVKPVKPLKPAKSRTRGR